jgi:hypothetical protein
MAGYIRQDTSNNIADGNIINASDFDNEYNAIEAAFSASTGHTHDGTAAEGAPITKIGPTQDVVASASALTPKTDNTVDLGSSTLEYKDLLLTLLILMQVLLTVSPLAALHEALAASLRWMLMATSPSATPPPTLCR